MLPSRARWSCMSGPNVLQTRDVLDELRDAAARKWQGDPAAQRAGLFARAAAELADLRRDLKEAEAQAAAMVAAERERCATLCEANSAKWDKIGGDGGASLECADAIRGA